MGGIFPFPGCGPADAGATRWQIWRSRSRRALCGLVHRLGLPGFVRDYEVDDLVTGFHIHIRVTRFGTYIHIGGRDYSFDRLTGKWIGSGMVTCGPKCSTCP
jgi:hypothetical protein